MRKLILAVTVGALLLVGASVAVAQTEDGSDTAVGRVGGLITDVLEDLVSDGTLTQDQADAVVTALDDKRSEFRAQREEVRAAWDEAWSDDVLTEEEAASLADSTRFGDRLVDPEGPLAEYWEDGQLTRDELEEARGELGFGRGGHHRGPRGGLPDDSGVEQESTSFGA